MRFIDYILDDTNISKKGECPNDCDSRHNEKVPIVGVFPPQSNQLKGMIISRDPTTAFKDPYLKARGKANTEWHNELMTADAPPQWLIKKIKNFDEKYMNSTHSNDLEILEQTISNNVYWTHLHKCCTDKKDHVLGAIHFKHKNGELCANKWLMDEIKEAKILGLKFIICLGKDVESFIEPRESTIKEPDIKIFYIPHPSGANNGEWYPKDPDKKAQLMKNIDDLFLACMN